MLSKTLNDAVQQTLTPKSTTAFSLNFKLEGETADHFDRAAQAMNKSRTELAKFILTHTIGDVLSQIDTLAPAPQAPSESLDDTLRRLVRAHLPRYQVGDQFELKTLLGEDWARFGEHGDRNRAGKQFKRLLEAGEFPQIAFVQKQSNNHALYTRRA